MKPIIFIFCFFCINNCSAIVGGCNNTVCGDYGVIGGGVANTISSAYINNIIGGGQGNCMEDQWSSIVGGLCNYSCSKGMYNFLGGGCNNTIKPISNGVCFSAMGGGNRNNICGNAVFIGGGGCNTASGCYNSIAGGFCNTASGGYNAIAGGWCNCSYSISSIGGGHVNFACGVLSGVFSGGYNTVNSNSNYSAIASGCNNSVGTASGNYSNYGFIGGGKFNCIDSSTGSSNYSFIGGGCNNKICAKTCFSAVLHGCSNTNSGNYSAILGGSGNTIPATCSYVGIFGQNITTVCSGSFHTNCMVVQNIPPGIFGTTAPPTGAIPGTLYYYNTGSGCIVYVA